jgi:lipoprotein signal peptidase
MIERSYRWLFWTLAICGLLLDQASKYGVFHWLQGEDVIQWARSESGMGEYPVIDGAFQIEAHYRVQGDRVQPQVNQGALFGLGGDHETQANTFFAVISVAAAVAILYWSMRRATARDWVLCAALGLILAGTLGNLYDRLLFNGVRDFIHVYWGQLPDPRFNWPVFNIADCCLVVGAGVLLTQAFLSRSPAEKPALEKSLAGKA